MMKRITGAVLFFCFMLFLAYSGYSAQLEISDYSKKLDFEGTNVVLIQPGDDMRYVSPDFDDSAWQTISIPSNNYKVFTNNNGFCWYRIHVKFPKDLPVKTIGLILGRIIDVDETYFNGVKIGSRGTFKEPRIHAYEWLRCYEIPTPLIKTNADNVIAIRVKGDYDRYSGFNIGPFYIQQYDKIVHQFFFREIQSLSLIIAYFVVAAYFLFFFLRRPKEKENLMFGLFAFTLACYSFLRTDIRYFITPNYNLLKKIEYFFLFLLVPMFTEFTYVYFKQKKSLLEKIALGIVYGGAVVGIILVLATWDIQFWSNINKNYMQYSWLIGIVALFSVMIRNFKGNKDAKLVLGSFILLFAAAINDTLVSRGIINSMLLLTYGFFFVVMSIALILANRFVRLHNEVEDLNINLEQKVQMRTKQVRDLLEQQNGDYFLTSLLIKPLLINKVKSDTIKIDFYLNQKKKFKFRKWESELGGDLCITNEITLQGRKYIAFINGDAMGKSLQGAGGSLVMGVMFNTIIERTRSIVSEQKKSPELWLQLCYNELETVFETFDGSMLISGIVGLIDEETGDMHYFNAEHPWLVLYRDGKPRFVESEKYVGRKIGTVGFAGVTILKLQLRAGDVLFMGSDGRDDIKTGDDADTGQRVINEDENLFLQRVTDGNGKIKEVAQAVEAYGELTDDLSLMRIAFKEADSKA